MSSAYNYVIRAHLSLKRTLLVSNPVVNRRKLSNFKQELIHSMIVELVRMYVLT